MRKEKRTIDEFSLNAGDNHARHRCKSPPFSRGARQHCWRCIAGRIAAAHCARGGSAASHRGRSHREGIALHRRCQQGAGTAQAGPGMRKLPLLLGSSRSSLRTVLAVSGQIGCCEGVVRGVFREGVMIRGADHRISDRRPRYPKPKNNITRDTAGGGADYACRTRATIRGPLPMEKPAEEGS